MPLTGEQIRVKGLAALRKELGRAGLARFLRHYETGEGDYTSDRVHLLKGLTMAELRGRAETVKPSRRKERTAKQP